MKLNETIKMLNEESNFIDLKIRKGGRNEITSETEKAYLVSQVKEEKGGTYRIKAWFPKSQVSLSKGILKIPEWLFNKSGLEMLPDYNSNEGMSYYVYSVYKTQEDYNHGKEDKILSGDLIAKDNEDAIERIQTITDQMRIYAIEARDDSGKIIKVIK